MTLYILRGAFIILAASVTMLYVSSFQEQASEGPRTIDFPTVVLMLAIAMGISGSIVAIDIFVRRKRLSALSGIFLGLIAGMLGAFALSFVVDLIGLIYYPHEMQAQAGPVFNLLQGVKILIGLITCYLSISLVIQTKDDFRFILPYIEFAKQIRGARPILLDTSVIIDGRILDILDTRILQSSLIIPKFVIDELQTLADSADKLKRARGRRGLDIVQKLRDKPQVDATVDESETIGPNVDQKLVTMAQETQARIMTNDFNLNKSATVRGVEVINLNDLAKAMRPVYLPGEAMHVRIVKPGEGPTQGVGYLEDGTMVVVEQARQSIGNEIELLVTSTLQTSAGRMIFGRRVGADVPPATESDGPGPRPGGNAPVPQSRR